MKSLPRLIVAAAAIVCAAPSVARAELPTLTQAIEAAKTHALVVVEAEEQVHVANAQMKGARLSAIGNPYIDLQVDKGFGNGVQQELQVLTYSYIPIDVAGQRGKRVDEAERLIAWRKMGLTSSEWIAAGEAAAAYGELLVSSSRVVEAKAGEATAREEAKYFQGRYDAKDTTLYEKSIAEAEVARWVQSRAEAELRVASSRARFEQVTGMLTDGSPPAPASVLLPALRGTWDDGQIARVVDRAPSISRLAAEKSYWDASIERYEREKIPPVSFEIIAGRGSAGEARLGGGAVFTFPVTRRYQAEIARAESGREHAHRQLDLYRGIVVTRLRAARDAIAAVNRALDELDKNGIPALERAVSTSVEAFRAGKIDLTRAMLARRDLAIARARRLDLLEASWRAYADLLIFSGELP
ncbi:MAG: TolC family protein [Labilithrix sp.]|nr:TolC family protein [Labilithrix sp.]MCW5815229.1 TolC family protein [Labilithrix sp.]